MIQSTDISKIHNHLLRERYGCGYNNRFNGRSKWTEFSCWEKVGAAMKSTLLEMLAGITKANFNLFTDIENYHHWCFAKDALVYVNQQVKPWGEELSGFIDLSSNNEVLLSIGSSRNLS